MPVSIQVPREHPCLKLWHHNLAYSTADVLHDLSPFSYAWIHQQPSGTQRTGSSEGDPNTDCSFPTTPH